MVVADGAMAYMEVQECEVLMDHWSGYYSVYTSMEIRAAYYYMYGYKGSSVLR